jgi:hypothetical protein
MSDFNELMIDMDAEIINTFSEKVLISEQLVDAVFDSSYINAFESDHQKPYLSVMGEQYGWIVIDMKVRVRGDDYVISSVQPDQSGLIMLFLEKQ